MTGTLTGLTVVRAGTLSYHDAWAEQRRLHAAVVAGTASNTVLLLEHPSVYTAGRLTKPEDRPTDGTPVVEVDRGGQITWHGPGQLVGYPILTLPGVGEARPIDVVAYVRRMEQMLIDVCAEFGVTAERIKGRSGAWIRGATGAVSGSAAPSGAGLDGGLRVGAVPGAVSTPDRKIAAVGIRVARGVTQHGFALNCNSDLTAYDKIVACGIRDAGATSLSAEVGRDVSVAEVLPIVERHLSTLLG